MTHPSIPPMPQARGRLWRILFCWLTWYRFAFYFRLAGEPRPRWQALRFTWLTL